MYIYIQNQDQPFADNSSDVNESQSIDINSIHLNKHAPNNCESTTSGSDNIATRVRAKNAKSRQKKIHRKSQHFTARNRDSTSFSESLSYEYEPRGYKYTMDVDLVEVDNSI